MMDLAAWQAMWRALGARQVDEGLHAQLIAAWSEPHRHYHTLQHLRECLEHFDSARSDALRPAEIELALWFHDAHYDPHRGDNEARSADWARRSVIASGASTEVADRVHALVMATVHDEPPQEPDAQLIVDVDLAILGAARERFDESGRQIRAEYAHVPAREYQEGRRRVLRHFLGRSHLYNTARFRQLFEQRARDNLQRALAELEAHSA